MNKQLGNVIEYNQNQPDQQTEHTSPKSREEQLLDFLLNMNGSCEIALVLGEIYSLKNPDDIPPKLKQLMTKQRYVLCPGNIGPKQNKQWLESLSKNNLIAVKGDLDSEGLNLNETVVIKIGKIKIGMMNGHQLKSDCNHSTLFDVAK